MQVIFSDPDIHPILVKTSIFVNGTLDVDTLEIEGSQKNITPNLDTVFGDSNNITSFQGYRCYIFQEGIWTPCRIYPKRSTHGIKYDVICLVLCALRRPADRSEPPIYYNTLLWDDLSEEAKSMKATWDDINY